MRYCISRDRVLSIVGKTPWLLLLLSMGGWMLFVIAFGLTNHNPQLREWLGNEFDGRTHNLFFSFWVCCFVGGALYISAYLHLLFRRWYTSIAMHILTAVYLVSAGAAIMTETILNNLTKSFLRQTQPLWSYVQLEMAGCIISFLSLILLMALWPLLTARPLPACLLNLHSHSINQSQSHVPLVESGTQSRPQSRVEATGHQFAITNPSAAVPTTDVIAAVADGTDHETKALLPDKTSATE